MNKIYCSEVSQRVLPSNGNFQPLEDSRKPNGSLENCKQYKNRAILLVSRRVKITHSGYKTYGKHHWIVTSLQSDISGPDPEV